MHETDAMGMRSRWFASVGAALLSVPVALVAPARMAAAAVPATVSMEFSGDILIHRPLIAQALDYGHGAYDFTPMFARIAPIITAADVGFCHFETPIAPPGEPLSYHPIYGVPREVIGGMVSAGFDRCSTASNHSFDRGARGIDATVTALEEAGIASAGMARTPEEAQAKLFTVKGIRFAQLAYTFGLNGLVLPADQPWRVRLLDADRIIADARAARDRGAEYVVVNLHWGSEKNWPITAEQRRLAEALTAGGQVDLIVGEHVHVLQPIEQVNGKWVVYGMSNLISNLPGGADFPDASQDGGLFTLSVSRQADGSFVTSRPVVHPTWVDHAGYVVRPVLEDLADPATPAGVRAALEVSLARTRAVLGDYVATAPVGPVPARCAGEQPTGPADTGFVVDPSPAKYVPLDPARIYDSRDRGDDGYLCPGAIVSVPVAGRGGVPATGATAAVLNVTSVDAGGPGFVSAWPTGTARPTVSSLNLTSVGQVRANLVIVPLGAGGEVSFFAWSGTNLVVDVAGWFTPAASSADGRLLPVTPARLLDTRDASGPTGGQRLGAGASLDLAVVGRGGLPPTGVAAVVVNITATDATGAGFLTAWPVGVTRPEASNVNINSATETAPNLAVVRVGAGGAVSLFSHAAAHVVVDVTGYITDASALSVSAGLFVPLAPARVFDTRDGAPVAGPVPAGGTVALVHTGRAGLPTTRVGALALNVTAVDAAAAGFVTAFPTASGRPATSTLNVVAGDVRPNATIMKVDTAGSISYFAQRGAHLVVDVTGYFTSAA